MQFDNYLKLDRAAEPHRARFNELALLLMTQRPVSLPFDSITVETTDAGWHVQTWWFHHSICTETNIFAGSIDREELTKLAAGKILQAVRQSLDELCHDIYSYERRLLGVREREVIVASGDPSAIAEGYPIKGTVVQDHEERIS